MKVGDLVKHKRTGDIALVIRLSASRPSTGIIKVLIAPSLFEDWDPSGCEVISESH